eukprot:9484193-Ditylum_brightwellii.AAC.1
MAQQREGVIGGAHFIACTSLQSQLNKKSTTLIKGSTVPKKSMPVKNFRKGKWSKYSESMKTPVPEVHLTTTSDG